MHRSWIYQYGPGPLLLLLVDVMASVPRTSQVIPLTRYRLVGIFATLHEAEILIGQGKKVSEVVNANGISDLSEIPALAQ